MAERNQHVPEGFNAQQLYEYLSQFTPEERVEQKVFIRVAPEGQAFNVKDLDYIQESTYGFFGKSLPCLVLNDTRFAPPDPDEEEEEASE